MDAETGYRCLETPTFRRIRTQGIATAVPAADIVSELEAVSANPYQASVRVSPSTPVYLAVRRINGTETAVLYEINDAARTITALWIGATREPPNDVESDRIAAEVKRALQVRWS